MACANCGPNGCSTKSDSGSGDTKVSGCSSGGCATGGCNRLNNYDWLRDMELPALVPRFNVVEIRFKGGRKEFYRNPQALDLIIGDAVQVDVGGGYHIGRIAMTGELVRLQLKRKGVKEDSPEIKNIYRMATQKEMERHQEVANRELPTLFRCRHLVEGLGLKMKVSDVEYQADGTKATFFYSAEDRVDFRDLIKQMAAEFKVRIDMRQISLRQEAGRIGGIGSCGRELCCSTWLTDFKGVSTSAARYQNLSLNPIKLSGQCGRLKCCLNYELETYMDALKDIPKIDKPIQTVKGEAHLQKTDIFKQILWFGYKNETTWHALSATRVKQLIALNKAGEKAVALTLEEEEMITSREQDTGPLNEDIYNLDKKLTDQRRKEREAQKQRHREREEARGPRKPTVSSTDPTATTSDELAVGRPMRSDRPDRGQRPDRNKSREGRGDQPRDQARDQNRGPRSDQQRNRPTTPAGEADGINQPKPNAAVDGQPPAHGRFTARPQRQNPDSPSAAPGAEANDNVRTPRTDRPDRPRNERNDRGDRNNRGDRGDRNNSAPRPPRSDIDGNPIVNSDTDEGPKDPANSRPEGNGGNRNNRNRGRNQGRDRRRGEGGGDAGPKTPPVAE